MLKKWVVLAMIVLAAVALMNGCSKKNKDIASNPSPLSFTTPAGFPEPIYKFEGNPLTKEGFELGRKLFYDGILSKDGNFPCSSCHQQFAGFSTFDHDLSHGINNQFTTRNTPALINLAWIKELHWDGGVTGIESEPVAHITASNEMGEDINHVISKISQVGKYKEMFRAAFGTEEINSQRMLKALTHFTESMTSANSRYDKIKRGEGSFNAAEQTGYNLFLSNCAGCHKEPLFTDGSYRNNGMPLNPLLKDFGRMRITGKSSDSLKFRVPGLRNVLITFPYSHDGRFYSLDNVLNHYATGIQNSPTLDPLLKNKIPLTTEERYYVKTFLATLTDSTFINDTRFSEPK